MPLQKAAALAWSDQKHVTNFRKIYKQNLILAKEILNINIPNSTFFIWLKVKDDQQAAKILWNKFSLRVMPGSFMAKDINGVNPGNGFLRISLVDNKDVIEEAMKRIKLFLQSEIS